MPLPGLLLWAKRGTPRPCGLLRQIAEQVVQVLGPRVVARMTSASDCKRVKMEPGTPNV